MELNIEPDIVQAAQIAIGGAVVIVGAVLLRLVGRRKSDGTRAE